MPKYINMVRLRIDCDAFAREAARHSAKFAMSAHSTQWFKGHEEELVKAFEHYAEIGAREAINHLVREGIL